MAVGLIWMWSWWTFMVIINVVNIISAILVSKRSHKLRANYKDEKYRKWMLAMGFIFTLVGLYRSIFVTSYGARRAWFNTILNSAGVVRTLAMFAELSFAGLIAYAMLKFNTYLPAPEDAQANKFKKFILTKSPYILPICIFLANICINIGLVIKFTMLGAIEETLWAIGFVSILPLAIIQLRRVLKIKGKEQVERFRVLKASAIVIVVWCVVYCCFCVFYNVPSYWSEQIELIRTGYPPIQTGLSALIDAFSTINVLREYSDWGFGFVFWHSAYFSVSVWISIFLMQAPRPLDTPRSPNAKKLTRIIITAISLTIVVLLVFIILPLFL